MQKKTVFLKTFCLNIHLLLNCLFPISASFPHLLTSLLPGSQTERISLHGDHRAELPWLPAASSRHIAPLHCSSLHPPVLRSQLPCTASSSLQYAPVKEEPYDHTPYTVGSPAWLVCVPPAANYRCTYRKLGQSQGSGICRT